MKVNGKHYTTIWLKEDDERIVCIIDQRLLPHKFGVIELSHVKEMEQAISDMAVRGAGLIGAAAGYGMYLATVEAQASGQGERFLQQAAQSLIASRPTAVNLEWAVKRQLAAIASEKTWDDKVKAALLTAKEIAREDAEHCREIGKKGRTLLEDISKKKNGAPVQVLTHCNAGWLAFVDYGSATAPIYEAFEKGIDLHVWVDETRPRNQGASLTAWELSRQGIPHTVITDNTGGHLMQQGRVDLVITGADRVTTNGDVANKIGTYLKALAAFDNNVPFYVALPSSTFDWNTADGSSIAIEERSGDEVKYVYGLCDGDIKKVLVTPSESPALNFGFDVTPSRLITGLITDRGICNATREGISRLYPDKLP
jgi:methylthioribose-1-phosphate isomerase